jgi:predicted RNA-binding Zn-ribbon protein involved in translation (DUF1610 family)
MPCRLCRSHSVMQVVACRLGGFLYLCPVCDLYKPWAKA